MPDKLHAAVIGVGNMGVNHARIYAELENVDLVAIADISEDIGKRTADNVNTEWYEDYTKMLEERTPDVVSICVPTSLHFEVAKTCIMAGIHVLLEKPISMDIDEGKTLLDLAKQYNVKFFVGHIERFNPAVLKVKEMIQNGELGNITAIMARRVGGFPPQIKDADIAVDLAIHDIDIVNFLLDELPTNVSVHKQKNHIEKRADAVEFFMQYTHASAYVQANWITPVKIRKLTITGSEGYLEMDYINQKIAFYKSNYEKFKERIRDYSDYVLRFSEPDDILISVAKKEPLAEELKYFIHCVQSNTPVNSVFALHALKIAMIKSPQSVKSNKALDYFVHQTADVHKDAQIGNNTKIWNLAQVRERATIGSDCIISKNVYIDFDVKIGDNSKIQNNCSVYHGTTIEDGVFVGPHVVFTNDKNPRAINIDGSPKSADDWQVGKIHVKTGASVGARSVILPGVTIGKFALVGAGSVVTSDVPDFSLVYGNPAKIHGKVDANGTIIERF